MKRLFTVTFYLFQLITLLAEAPHSSNSIKFNPTNPGVHDPVIAREDSVYYLFSTGVGINMLASDDLMTWRKLPSPLDPIPTWPMEYVPAYRGHTWAPDIIKVSDKWFLYYTCSTFSKNISAIGVATNKTLNPDSPDYKWEDHGMVLQSQPHLNDWNAIDPNVVIDDTSGRVWMTFGSFWDGIQLVELSPADMQTPISTPKTIARRIAVDKKTPDNRPGNINAIEAPFIIKRGDFFYLFVSYDFCCKGLSSNYKTAVGRSRDIAGPYLGRDGRPMTEGGHHILVSPDAHYAGVGHCAVYQWDGKWYFIAHAYDRSLKGASKLFIRPLSWTADGWPEILSRFDRTMSSSRALKISNSTNDTVNGNN